MSLIDDALKRAQAAGEVAPSRPGDRPWTPTPMPDAGLALRRKLTRWFVIGMVAAAAGIGGFFVLRPLLTSEPHLQTGRGREDGRAAALPIPIAPTPTLEAVIVPSPIPSAAPRPRPTRVPMPADAATAPGEATASPPPPAPAASRIADGRSYVGSLNLPGGAKIELGGIVWSETEPRALLNDRVVKTGAYVEGYELVKIEENRVVLQKDGVTISVSVK